MAATDEQQASWIHGFEGRRVAAMTVLYQSAVAEYRAEVDASQRRITTFLWIAITRWSSLGLQFLAANFSPVLRLGFVMQALVGLVFGLFGVLTILRGQAYYRAARDHMIRCADVLQPGDWAPATTRRVHSRIWKIRTMAIAILCCVALLDLWVLIWALAFKP